MSSESSSLPNPDCMASENPHEVTQVINPYSLPLNITQVPEVPIKKDNSFISPVINLVSSQFDGPPVCKVEPTDNPDFDISYSSATKKALVKLDIQKTKKKILKKRCNTSKLKKKLSTRLSPKNAEDAVKEIKPGCVFNVKQQSECVPAFFFAEIEHKNCILGTGQGWSESQAKKSAAENAIKRIASTVMSQKSSGETTETKNSEDSLWAGLASYALFKLFNEWNIKNSELSSTTKKKTQTKTVNVNSSKKSLPPNAVQCHPTAVLNLMHPGITVVEIEREEGLNPQVKMGYVINGQMFTGVGRNKKSARMEAAKVALLALHNLTYPS